MNRAEPLQKAVERGRRVELNADRSVPWKEWGISMFRPAQRRMARSGVREPDLAERLMARAAERRRLLGHHVGRTRPLLEAMLPDKVTMTAVVVNGRRGYRFTGRLRLAGLRGEALETRHILVRHL